MSKWRWDCPLKEAGPREAAPSAAPEQLVGNVPVRQIPNGHFRNAEWTPGSPVQRPGFGEAVAAPAAGAAAAAVAAAAAATE